MLTESQLRALFPRAGEEHIDAFMRHGPKLFLKSGIFETSNRLHFFLAQIGHESGGLTVVEENLSYSAQRLMEVFPRRFPTLAAAQDCAGDPKAFGCAVYGGRLGNGAAPSVDGYTYRGRGYIQLTGRSNYVAMGSIAGISNLVDQPEQAALPSIALALACAFWESRKLNQTADADDFVACTRKINGGTVGMTERRAWLLKVRRTLAEPPTKQPDAQMVLAVQKALLKLGFKEVGAPDGLIGRNTVVALARFRAKKGIADSGIDENLLKALGLPGQ